MSEYAIDVQNVSKIYKLYDRSRDRLAEALHLTKKKLSKDHYALDQISFQVKKGRDCRYHRDQRFRKINNLKNHHRRSEYNGRQSGH